MEDTCISGRHTNLRSEVLSSLHPILVTKESLLSPSVIEPFFYFSSQEKEKKELVPERKNLEKLGLELWCFHDRDITPDEKTLEMSLFFLETNKNLDEVVELVKELQKGSILYGALLSCSCILLHGWCYKILKI